MYIMLCAYVALVRSAFGYTSIILEWDLSYERTTTGNITGASQQLGLNFGGKGDSKFNTE